MKTFKQLIEDIAQYDPNHPDPAHHEAEFHRRINQHYPRGAIVYHESPGHVAASMKKHGIVGSYGIFGTIGQPSNFVTGPKTTVTFRVPPVDNKPGLFVPDMRYDPENPHKDLLEQHPNLDGADVCLNVDRVPPSRLGLVREE